MVMWCIFTMVEVHEKNFADLIFPRPYSKKMQRRRFLRRKRLTLNTPIDISGGTKSLSGADNPNLARYSMTVAIRIGAMLLNQLFK